MNNILPTVLCPNCGASSSTYENCEFCGSSLAGVVSKEMIEAEKARQKRIAEEARQHKIAEEERLRKLAEAEKARQQAEAERQKQEEQRRKFKKALPFIILSVLFLIGGGIIYNNQVRLPNIERTDWETAMLRNTIWEFESFIQLHPNSEHIEMARVQIDSLRAQHNRERLIAEERRREQEAEEQRRQAQREEERRRQEQQQAEMQRRQQEQQRIQRLAERARQMGGVVIGDVIWATRNVGTPGTFAASPENAGMFFQWNRRKGWAATGDVTGWDSSTSTSTVWERANDPCPQGWRVPTRVELESLNNAGSAWGTHSGVSGRFFGTVPNQIFLPAAGWRSNSHHPLIGRLFHVGMSGNYWSSTQVSSMNNAWHLFFTSTSSFMNGNYNLASGFSIRCVAAN